MPRVIDYVLCLFIATKWVFSYLRYLLRKKKSFFFLGIRWLLTKKETKKAKEILEKASKLNKTALSENSILLLKVKAELRSSQEDLKVDSSKSQNNFRKTVQVLCIISYLWFATIFVYYGLNINSVYLEYWNKYVSYIVSIKIRFS